ncbi:unnamed protein product, partial [Strongylus vulgaris]
MTETANGSPKTPHRGFNNKARGVLIGADHNRPIDIPVVVHDTPTHSPIAPHRGFNSKAREMLIGDNDKHLTGMPTKSASEFDLMRKVVGGLKKPQSPVTPSSPKTPNSTCSNQEPRDIDSELTDLDINSERGGVMDGDELCKARVYEVPETQKKKNVAVWLSKQSQP